MGFIPHVPLGKNKHKTNKSNTKRKHTWMAIGGTFCQSCLQEATQINWISPLQGFLIDVHHGPTMPAGNRPKPLWRSFYEAFMLFASLLMRKCHPVLIKLPVVQLIAAIVVYELASCFCHN